MLKKGGNSMSYEITQKAKIRFKKWLVEQETSMNQFAKKCGVSHQYISSVINGKINVTESVIETFKKGGYDFI